MEQNNVTSVLEFFRQMPTDTLREMLNKELHTEPVNDDAIRLILSVLRERETEADVEMTPELAQAWDKYQRKSRKVWESSRRYGALRSWMVRAVSAAAVVALLVAPILPKEAGAESLWDALTRLTAGIVEFFGPSDNEDRILEYEFKTDNPGLQQVYDKAVELGVTVPIVPMWLPVGYELVEYRVENFPASTRLHSRFVCDNESIVYYIDIYNSEVSHKYQRNEDSIGYHENGGVKHQIFKNNDVLAAVWTKNNIECSIFIECQEDTLYRILNSIYGMGGHE